MFFTRFKTNNRIFTILVLTALLLSGCAAVGPDYQGPPEVDLPKAWNHQLEQTSESGMDLQQWWKKFNDTTLNSLMDRANTGNLDIRIALSRIDEAEAQYGVVTSQYYPTVDAIGIARRTENSENLVSFLPRNQDFQAIGSSLNWEIDLFGRIRRQSESAQANVDAFAENYRDVMVVLQAEIASTYITVRTLQKRLQLANKNVANQRESVGIVRARYEAELTSELDVNQAEQNLARSESVIPLLNAGLSKSMNHLAVLLGEAPRTLNAELKNVEAIPTIPNEVVNYIPRDVVRQRPDIRRVERQLAAQTAQIGVAKANLYPRLSLSGLFGFATSDGDLTSSSSNTWSFGPNLSWNIFDAGRKRNQVKIQDARAEQARAAYEKTVLGAFEDVEAGLIDYNEEQSRSQFLNKSVEAAQKTVKIAKSQYRSGLTNFQTVLDAERVLFAEEDRLADSQGAKVRYLVGIYRAMGGGWNADQAIENN